MAKKDRTIATVKSEIETATTELDDLDVKRQAAAQKREALIDEHDELKVKSFDPALVALAITNGINPKNFDSDATLRTAIERGVSDAI